MAEAAAGLGLTSAHFWRVPPDYYDQELSWRRDVLGASTTAQLCKSMIMENTRLADVSTEEAAASGNATGGERRTLLYWKPTLRVQLVHMHMPASCPLTNR